MCLNVKLYLFLFLTISMAATASASTKTQLQALEVKHKMHVGVYATQGEKSFGFRESERFAYCSVFKWILCAQILKMSEVTKLDLNKKISYTPKEILKHSPVTSKHLEEGAMSVRDLCSATVSTSDNTAAVLLTEVVGGLTGLQQFVRSQGDSVTRFDRPELDLNSNLAGDERDTTTPQAMSTLLKHLLSTEALKEESKKQLMSWLKATTTGGDRIRAGTPKDWVVADKTGTGDHGAANDVAILFPPKGSPIYISVFTSGDGASIEDHEKGIAEATQIVLKEFNKSTVQ